MAVLAERRNKPFQFKPFSINQKKVLTWWSDNSPYSEHDCLIADGAVRSGKTLILSLSYVIWAMQSFNLENFGMAGKTVGSFRRNVLFPLKTMLRLRGYKVTERRNENCISISKGSITNYFYIFGGRDERSQDLVQGFTSAGFLFDEVALMPESFVNQAVARCSIEGRKFWFNCNPDGPFHWFKVNWIDQLEVKNALRIHFSLDDNPSLSDKMKDGYRRLFSGLFYDRFILGLWSVAEGVIYSMFRPNMVINKLPSGVKIIKKWIGTDYGQSNATAFILCGLGNDNKLYILDEYYHEGKASLEQKSPSKYSKDYFRWKKKIGKDGMPIQFEYNFIDPSAKGFMLQLHEDGERRCRQADNTVLKGIELISSIMDTDMFRIMGHCTNTIKELASYRWDVKAQERGIDAPIKQYDHALDAIRYVINGTRMIWQRLIVEEEKKMREAA